MRSETTSRAGSVLVQKLCHVEDDEHISALDVFSTRRMDARIVASENCWSGIEEKVSEISRELD